MAGGLTELRRIDSLRPYPKNARTHSAEQVALIARSIEEFDWTYPVLIDSDGTVIAGHGRLEAARSLGLEEVPTLTLGHLTPAQVDAYRLADNRLSELADWDEELLRGELEALREADFDLSLTGWDDDEIAQLLADETPSPAADEVPEPPEEPITQPGDLWILGDHRLICGDSTDPETVARVLEGAEPYLMVTDPPYGVSYEASWRSEAGIHNRPAAYGQVLNDDRTDWSEAYRLFPGCVAYVWVADPAVGEVQGRLEELGFVARALIVWHKTPWVIGRGHYNWQHETCWYAVRKGQSASWCGDGSQSTVWDIPKPQRSETGHSTQKPVECMERPIRNHRGDVYDPFVGSGTTLIAAERQRRRCFAVELNPAYCDVAVKRWEDYTGQEAVRDG